MTVRQLIQDLTYYPMDAEITVSCNYSEEQVQKEKCKGAVFEITNLETFGEQVQIIFNDWRKKTIKCPHCGIENYSYFRWCPDCGADMGVSK